MQRTGKYWIDKLNLDRHPEGGFYREIYRSEEIILAGARSQVLNSERNFSTAIYFLLQEDDFSAFHRLQSDEIWHFYDGSPLLIHILNPDGKRERKYLGIEIDEQHYPQVVIPKHTWFAAEVINKSSYILIGCTVSPGFDFDDFNLARRDELLGLFPQHKKLIMRLTRE